MKAGEKKRAGFAVSAEGSVYPKVAYLDGVARQAWFDIKAAVEEALISIGLLRTGGLLEDLYGAARVRSFTTDHMYGMAAVIRHNSGCGLKSYSPAMLPAGGASGRRASKPALEVE